MVVNFYFLHILPAPFGSFTEKTQETQAFSWVFPGNVKKCKVSKDCLPFPLIVHSAQFSFLFFYIHTANYPIFPLLFEKGRAIMRV